jgi:uncharacterized membrane protein YuzA (DUF378 family)
LWGGISMNSRFNYADYTALILLIIGGLNWGLVGVFDFDLVALIFGSMTIISRMIYVLVGLSSLYMIYTLYKMAFGQREGIS